MKKQTIKITITHKKDGTITKDYTLTGGIPELEAAYYASILATIILDKKVNPKQNPVTTNEAQTKGQSTLFVENKEGG